MVKKLLPFKIKIKNNFTHHLELDEMILYILKYPFLPIQVTYKVDYNNYSYENNGKKRYYANNVKMINMIII
jgi:hypothetical protein